MLLACLACVLGSSADAIPNWHPHAARRRQERKAREAAEEADKPVWSDIGCGTIQNSKWERQVCFGDVVEVERGSDGIVEVAMNATVTWKGTVPDAEWQNACGDALRIRFLSTRSIFAPRQEEVECGVKTLSFIMPPDATEYEAEVYVVHVDGEGVKEPQEPRLFPINLVNFADGPDIYNLLVGGFKGRLHIPASHMSDTTDLLDSYSLRSAGWPVPDNAGAVPNQARRSPECVDGDAPGRWVFHQSMTPQVPGEPLEWRPYRCHYRWYSGEQLARCMERVGRVKLVGESTLGQMYELLLAHMNASGFYWPRRIEIDEARPTWGRTDAIRAQGLHSEFHGLSVVDELAEVELREWAPDVIVQLQAANDAARDSFEMYDQRMRKWIDKLQGLIREGAIAPKRHIWITAPVRHYKAGNGPGMAECREGTIESCTSVYHATQFEDSLGEVNWLSGKSEPPMFWGTLDRRRKFNAHAVKLMRAAFPDLEVVDFEAITEGLPSDYCIDGEHWGCNARAWDNRHREPYQCKSLGNIVLGMMFANTLCNKVMQQ